VFVYARGSIHKDKDYKQNWSFKYVTEGLKLNGTDIDWGHFKKWIKENKSLNFRRLSKAGKP